MKRYILLVFVSLVCFGATSFGAPPYPYEARRAHLKGSGVFEAYLRPDRTVAKVAVVKRTGYRVLDEYAIAVLKEWRFLKAPPNMNTVKVPMTFGGSWRAPSNQSLQPTAGCLDVSHYIMKTHPFQSPLAFASGS